MRNLKRALSLALASVMLVGMMVVGTSAASFPDVDESKHDIEAIEVLKAVGVMNGDAGTGKLRPDDKVSRNEMAVIMARLILGTYAADSYVGSHPFTDVPSWADRYVAACYSSGIIKGTSATTYGGTNNVTAVQAAAMMLRALGYEDLSLGADRWDIPVAGKANEVNLFEGLNGSGTAQLTRNDIATLSLNALKTTMVTTVLDGMDVTLSDGTKFYATRRYNERQSSASWRNSIDITNAPGSTNGLVQLGEYLYQGDLKLDKVPDDFGRPASKWTYKAKSVIETADEADLTYTKDVKISDIYKDLGKPSMSGDKTATYTVDGRPSRDNANAVVDADALRASNDNKVGAKGALTSVYKNNDGDVKIVTVNTYLVKASADYSEKNEELSVIPSGVTLSSNKIKNDDVAVSEFKKDDLILVTGVFESGKLVVKTAELATLVEDVKVSAFNDDDYVTAGGTKYEYNATMNYAPDGGWVKNGADDYNPQKTAWTLVLDKYDYVIGVKKYSDEVTLDDYLFVKEAAKSGFNYQAKVLFMDGKEETVTIAATAQATSGTMTAIKDSATSGDAITAAGTAIANGKLAINRFYEFNKKSNGEYELTDLADTSRQGVGAASCTAGDKILDGGKVQPIAATWSTGTPATYVPKSANDNTIFIAKDIVYTGVKNAPDVTATATTDQVHYLLDKDSKYILAAYTAVKGVATNSTSEWVYILEANGTGEDDNEKKYDIYTAIKDGEKISYNVKDDASKSAGLYEINSTEDGYPVLGSPLTGSGTDDQIKYINTDGKNNSEITYKSGVVNAGKGLKVNNDTVVYVVDAIDKDVSTIDASAVDGIEAGTYNVYAIYVSKSDDTVKTLWLVKTVVGRTFSGTPTNTEINNALNQDGVVTITGTVPAGVTVGSGETLNLGASATVSNSIALNGGKVVVNGSTLPTVTGNGSLEVKTNATGTGLIGLAKQVGGTEDTAAVTGTTVTKDIARAKVDLTGAGALTQFDSTSLNAWKATGDGTKMGLYQIKLTGMTAANKNTTTIKGEFAGADGIYKAMVGDLGTTGVHPSENSGAEETLIFFANESTKSIKITVTDTTPNPATTCVLTFTIK